MIQMARMRSSDGGKNDHLDRGRVIRSQVVLLLAAVIVSVVARMAAAGEPTGVQAGSTEEKAAQDQKLEERVQNQEQRIKELEKRLQDMESAAMSGVSAPKSAASATAPERVAGTAAPEAIHVEVAKDEVRDSHKVLTGADLIADDFPGSWPMFGSDYRMKIGGYFKLDVLYDFDGTGDKFQFLISDIPVNTTPATSPGSYFNMFTRETRFNLDVRKRTAGEPAQQVFIEMDFFDESSTSPQLRHAYLVYGNLLLGQTWSTIIEARALPYVIDFAYGDALYGGRTTQIRWQQQASKHWSWAAAIEMLQEAGIDNPYGQPGAASSLLPVLTGRVTFERGSGLVILGGEVGQLRWDGNGSGPDAKAQEWAIVLNGRQYLGDRDYVTLNVSYSDGAAENISALSGSNANASLTLLGQLKTNKAWNIALGYAHKITERLTTNLAYAQTELDASYLRSPDSIKGGQVAHVNVIWAFARAMSTGIEYMWGERENTDGARGRAARVQGMAKYDF
jgi:hypothetical protein